MKTIHSLGLVLSLALTTALFSPMASADDDMAGLSLLAVKAEVTLATVTSDLVKDSDGKEVPAYIKITIDGEGRVQSFKYEGKDLQTGEVTTETWPASALATGIVPIPTSATFGKKAVVLRSNTFDPAHGGPIVLDYLSAVGLGGDRRGKTNLDLVRTGANWELLADDSAGRRVIHSIRVVARRTLGKPTGISQIILN